MSRTHEDISFINIDLNDSKAAAKVHMRYRDGKAVDFKVDKGKLDTQAMLQEALRTIKRQIDGSDG